MNSSQTFMKEKPVFKLLISMSIPVVLSMIIQSLYNIVDSIWVTRLGTDALTAVSLAFPLQNAIMSFGVGMGIGIGSIVSISLGAGDRKRANHTVSIGMVLVLIHCVLFLICGIFLTKPFLQLFTTDSQTLQWSCEYTYIVMCLSFGELIQMCFEKIFQAVGKMKTTMLLTASGCIINIVLDPILIFGWFGFPAMGVKGAAVATVVGQIIAMFLYVVVLLRKDIGVDIRLRYIKFDKELIKKIYTIGVPSSLMLAMPSVLTGVLNGILAKLGSIYVAVFGLYFKLQTFINLPSNGVVQGMRPIISYNYGAGEFKRVKQVIQYSIGIVAIIMIIGTVGAVVFPENILKFFAADAELMKYGIPALRIIGFSFLISTIGIVTSGVFEALGKGKDSLIISLLRQLMIIVPVGLVLSKFWGANGIWVAFLIAEIIALSVSVVKLNAVGILRSDNN